MRTYLILRWAFVAGLAWLTGCGGADRAAPARLPVFPVEGRIFIDGTPTVNVQIAFHPLDSATAVLRPVGVSAADGSFRLTTYAFGDGAPAGEYAVTVLWVNDSVPFDECGDATIHDRLNGYYLDPANRRILATVAPGSNAIALRVAVASTGWNLPKQRPNDGNSLPPGD